jgi:hypothetical protein
MSFAIDWNSIAELEPPIGMSLLIKTDQEQTYAGFYEGNHCFKCPVGENVIKYLYSANTDLKGNSITTGKQFTLGESGKSIDQCGKVTHWNIPC